MKNFNFLILLIFQLLLPNISYQDDLLSKFHQNGFKIRDERLQLMRYNKSFYNVFEIKAFKYNRTTTAHNVTLNFKMDTHDKIEVLVQARKFLSNEYRYFPLRFQANLKKIQDANVLGLRNVYKCGNVEKFYFLKNISYRFCNYVIDETRFPPLIPEGQYQVEVTFLYDNIEISMFYIFGEVYIPFVDRWNKNG